MFVLGTVLLVIIDFSSGLQLPLNKLNSTQNTYFCHGCCCWVDDIVVHYHIYKCIINKNNYGNEY